MFEGNEPQPYRETPDYIEFNSEKIEPIYILSDYNDPKFNTLNVEEKRNLIINWDLVGDLGNLPWGRLGLIKKSHVIDAELVKPNLDGFNKKRLLERKTRLNLDDLDEFNKVGRKRQKEYIGRLLGYLTIGEDALTSEDKQIIWELLNATQKNDWGSFDSDNNPLLADSLLLDKMIIKFKPHYKRVLKDDGTPTSTKYRMGKTDDWDEE